MVDRDDRSVFDGDEVADSDDDFIELATGEVDEAEADNDSILEADEEGNIEDENETDLQDTQQLFVANNDIIEINGILGKCIQKSKVKGMNIVPLNMVAATDFMKTGRQALADGHLVQTREWGKKRNKRENYFLREKLFKRLQSMEEDTARSDRLSDRIETETRCRRMFVEYKEAMSSVE